MPKSRINITAVVVFSIFLWISPAFPQSAPPHNAAKKKAVSTEARVCARCIRAHMDFLASDALQGRGSGTPDELIAATYIASELEQYGVGPAGDNGSYIQRATLIQQQVTGAPQISFRAQGKEEQNWSNGKEFVVLHLGTSGFSGPLRKVGASEAPGEVAAGTVVFISGQTDKLEQIAFHYATLGAAAVIVPASDRMQSRWDTLAGRPVHLPVEVEGAEESDLGAGKFTMIAVQPSAAQALQQMPNETTVSMSVPAGPPKTSYTWNVVAKIAGSDPQQKDKVVLLTAHLDHLGVGTPVNGDSIYNGADDDASGTTAVLELARVLASGRKPRRTVVFALFGSEEKGGLGSTYFRQHPPVPLKNIVAYLEFEMIGRADPAVAKDELWMTGWKRTTLGPALVAHGAHLVADPHPDQHFFSRSDNYVFAKEGVVAQTVSSYGLHEDYHQPSDDVAHIDFAHMDEAIDSMLKPVLWLVNSDFVPQWTPGGKP